MSRLTQLLDRVGIRRPRTRSVRATVRRLCSAAPRAKNGHAISSRSDLIELIGPRHIVLEIGPLTNPTVRGKNVRYFDVLDEAGLIKYAESCNYPTANSAPIDYVSPNGDLSIVESEAYDVVFSSHCMEHQPDLVSHLNHIERILVCGGRYLFALPDHRYCFDHFIPASTSSEVIEAFSEKRQVHTIKSHINHATKTTHNDPVRHWNGDHGEPAGEHCFDDGAKERLLDSIAEGKYSDCHAWQFTPESLSEILAELRRCGLTSLTLEFVTPTPRNTFEFYGVLGKASPLHPA